MDAKLYASETYVNTDIGYTLRMNYSFSENFELHYHDFYEFFLTINGKAVQVINGKRQLLPEHSLVLVRSGDVHTYINEAEFSFVNLAFESDTMQKLCLYFGSPLEEMLHREMPPTVLLKKEDFSKVMERLNTLSTVSPKDKQKANLKMKMALIELLAYFMIGDTERNELHVPNWFSSLTAQAENTESIHMTLTDMAKISGRSREHISRCFKKYYGCTVSEFMNEQKLHHCANLLLNTDLSVLEICYECGFQNLSWFYRKFREKFSVTPAEFRKSYQRDAADTI